METSARLAAASEKADAVAHSSHTSKRRRNQSVFVGPRADIRAGTARAHWPGGPSCCLRHRRVADATSPDRGM